MTTENTPTPRRRMAPRDDGPLPTPVLIDVEA